MITNSRANVNKKPRDINKKHPGKTYLPRFLDGSNLENLKSSVDRELADISMHFEQERQAISKIIPGSTFQGQWDACSDKYPLAKEDSTWDVIVSCGKTHVFDGKTWESGHQLLYLKNADKYIQRTNPGTDGIKQLISELKVEIDNAEAKIQENKLAVADLNFAMSQMDTRLTAKVNENASTISQTNQVVSDLTSTVATNKTELQSSINGVRDTVNANKIAGDAADAENKKLIIEADAKISQTNTTVADLSQTVATNKLQMDSSFKAVNDRVDGVQGEVANTNAQLSILNETVSNLEGSIATNVTELRAEYKAADAKVAADAAADATNKANAVSVEAAAALAITNKTVSDLNHSLAQNVTEIKAEYKAADAVVANNAAADATAKANKVAVDAAAALSVTNKTVADLDKSLAQNVIDLKAEYKAADAKVASDAAAALKITNQTVADNKQAAASATAALKSEMDGKVATITSEMSTVANKVGTLESKWTVQADVNGKISGIEMVNNGRQSNFTIQTDRFVVTDGTTTKPPFSIEGGKVAMKDAVVSGTVQADAGEFRNVTIHETCTFLGTVDANNIKGDVAQFQNFGFIKKNFNIPSWQIRDLISIPCEDFQQHIITNMLVGFLTFEDYDVEVVLKNPDGSIQSLYYFNGPNGTSRHIETWPLGTIIVGAYGRGKTAILGIRNPNDDYLSQESGNYLTSTDKVGACWMGRSRVGSAGMSVMF